MNAKPNFARIVIAVLLTVSALGMSSSIALAKQPYMFDWIWDFSDDLTGICAFSIHVDSTMLVSEQDFFDQDGALIRIKTHNVEQDTFTANGKTLVGLEFSFNNDWIIDNGVWVHGYNEGVTEKVPLPDGSLFISAGRFDWFDHPGAVFIIDPDKGHTGDIDAFCAALAP